MDIVVKSREGKHFRLETHSSATRPSLPHTASNQAVPLTQIEVLLTNATPESPASWVEVWAGLKPLGQRALTQKVEVIAAIKSLASEQRLRITPSESRSGGSQSKSSTKNVGARAASGGSQTRAEETVLVPRRTTSIPPQASGTPYDENKAAQSSEPAEKQDQSLANTPLEGDPVSMISGEETLQFTDATLPGPMPFTWKRTYRSSHVRDIGLGVAWSHSGSEYLDLDQSTLKYVDGEGRSIPFQIPGIKQRSKYLPESLNLDCVSENIFILKQEGQWDKVFTRGNSTLKHFQLSELRDPSYTSPQHPRGEHGFCIRFHYSERNQLNRIQGNWGKSLVISRNATGHIQQLALHNDVLKLQKRLISYDYNEECDLIAYRNAKGIGEHYRYQNHLIQQRTLATGFRFNFEWDGEDHTARCIRNWGDRGIYAYTFEWDPENKCSKAKDSRGFEKTYRYNDYGQIIEEIDNEGGVHQTTYNCGRKISSVDPEGQTTQYFYSEEGQPAGQCDPLGHSATLDYFRGKPTTFVDKDKTRWRREYNQRGQLVELTDSVGQATRYSYTPQGQIRSVTDPANKTTLYQWGEQGELIKLTDPRGNAKQFHYDAWGHVIAVDALINGRHRVSTTHYHYNETGLITQVIAPNGDEQSYTYNENDQLIKYSDPQGRVTEFVYDGLSQVVERIDAEGQRLKYEYDTERNLSALINENGERHQFVYDGNERLIKEIGFDGRTQHYSYNKAGHLIKHLDAGQVITTFERDALGRMLTKTSKALGISDAPLERTRYAYDAKGRITECYNPHQYLAFEYNGLGQPLKEHRSDLNAKQQRIKASMLDTVYRYSTLGLPAGINLPDGQNIDYGYDTHQQLNSIAFNGKSVTHIERDDFGREIARHQGSISTLSDYDPMGRLQKQHSVHQSNKAPGPIQRQYDYDAFGQLSRFTDGAQVSDYVYDMVGRLAQVSGEERERFHFDPASNIVSINDEKPEQAHGNRLTLQGDRKFTYDARGNLVQENRGKEGKLETRYHYNLNNQLIKVEKQGQTTTYEYDPLGRRTKKQDDFGDTCYVWAGDQLVQEQRKALKKTYLYEPHSFRPVAMVQDDKLYHYHLDHLGTPRELTDQAGKVVWKVRYLTYGNLAVKEVEEVENNLRFQGQYFDEETGLHYNRHRYYNPNTGQFTTQDPIGLLGGTNGYQYAPNPISWIDPLGLTCKENSWNQFQKNTKGHFANSSSASESYQKMKVVEAAPRGAKPPQASDYLPASYVDASMQKFNSEGSAFIVIESWTTGSRFSTLPPRKFVGLPSEMRPVIASFVSSGDVSILNDQLNLGLDSVELAELQEDRIMYVEIEPGDPRFSYEMPSGNEFGAIEGEWKPGGKTKAGVSEAALVGSENIDHEKSLSGYSKNFKNTKIIKDK